MKKILTMTAAAGLIAGSSAAHALQIDFGGNGNIGASVFYEELALFTSSAIITTALDPAGVSLSNAGFLYMQSVYSPVVGSPTGSALTFQVAVPILATQTILPGPSSRVAITLTGPGSFSLFYDEDGGSNIEAGTGFGNLNGGALNANQHLIASGAVSLQSNFRLNIDDFDGASPFDTGGLASTNNPLFATATSVPVSGSTNIDVDIMSQDSDFIVNDLIGGPGLTLDLTLQNIAFTAPFTIPNEASTTVVNHSAFLGDDKAQSSFCSSAVAGTRIDGTAVAAGSFCDIQAQIGGNTKFFAERVPEPTSLALAGLGLVFAGWAQRRRGSSSV